MGTDEHLLLRSILSTPVMDRAMRMPRNNRSGVVFVSSQAMTFANASPIRFPVAAPSTPTPSPTPATLHGAVVPLRPAAWTPSRYEPSRRSRLVAVTGAGAAVGALLAAFLSLGVIGTKPKAETFTAVRLSADLTPPSRPTPQQPAAAPVAAQPASPIVAPPSPIVMPASTPVASAAPAPVVIAAPAPVAAPAPAAPAAPAAPTIARGRDLSANLVEADPPRYPIDSRRAREQGTVELAVTVGTDGRVAGIGIARSSGFDRLDRAALAAVERWRWTPLRQNGVAAIVEGTVRIPFVLQG